MVDARSVGHPAREEKAGCAKPRLPSLESLPSFCTGCGSMAPNSAGHQRRLPINLHSKNNRTPAGQREPTSLPDAGVGAIVPGFAILNRAKRASHIDPPASSRAIMRRACTYRGENNGPGKDVHGELDPWPGIREQPGSGSARLSDGQECPVWMYMDPARLQRYSAFSGAMTTTADVYPAS